MITPIIIPAGLVMAAAVWMAVNRPAWLLAGYLVAVPLFPPIPVGPIELSMLDLLAIPCLIRVIYNMTRGGFVIRGSIAKAFFLVVAVAVVSFLSFVFQHALFSGSILFRIIRFVEMFLPVVLASQVIDFSQKEKTVKLFLCGGILAASAGILMYSAGISLRESQTFTAGGLEIFRAAGTHGNSGSFGSLMGFLALVSLWVLFYKTGFYRKSTVFLALAGIFSGAMGLFVSLSRGGMILLAVGTVVLVCPLLLRPAKLIKITMAGILVVLIAVPFAWKHVKSDLAVETLSELQDKVTGLSELSSNFESVSSHRTVHWIEGLRLYGSNPLAWPFGLGYKSLKLHYDTLPDNNFNQALFEMGIFGLIALLCLIGAGISEGIRQYRLARPEGIVIIALWMALLTNMISADVLTYWHNIPPMFILLIALGKTGLLPRSSMKPSVKPEMIKAVQLKCSLSQPI